MAEKKYTKSDPWISEEVKGNQVFCHEEGDKATCTWKNRNRKGGQDDVFILTSEEKKAGQFEEKICFAPVGLNLIEGTELEEKLDKGSNCITL
jgi:hypothetical protein